MSPPESTFGLPPKHSNIMSTIQQQSYNPFPQATAPRGQKIDSAQTQMSKEEVQKLIFSNSNALMSSSDIVPAEGAPYTAQPKNMKIVNTNHQFLID